MKYLGQRYYFPRIAEPISERFRPIDAKGMDTIEASLKCNSFSPTDPWYDETYLSSAECRKELQSHLCGRLERFRKTVVPWLSAARSLAGGTILEIGCGTGSLTVALAEQGATVSAIDIAETSLAVARDRCQVYGLDATFVNANATEVPEMFRGEHFDIVMFSATLEHLTLAERIIAMKNTWNMLSKGDLWCTVDTPNRLWFYDGHTSLLPFNLWLPDDLAFLYSQFSPRARYCVLYRRMNEQSKLDFLRRGRAVSFHEFELTMERATDLDIVSSLPIFLRKQSILRRALWAASTASRYERFLARAGPKIHRGFYQPTVDLIITKD